MSFRLWWGAAENVDHRCVMSARSDTGKLSSDCYVSNKSVRTRKSIARDDRLTFCSFALTFWFAICMCRTHSLRPSFVREPSAEKDVAFDSALIFRRLE